MATIQVINNKIRVTPGIGETNIIITIIQKTLDIFDNIIDNTISTSLSISVVTDSNELDDGVYEVLLSTYSPSDSIVFITYNIDNQRALFDISCVKTKDMIGQKDYRTYYDLISFAIQYDLLNTAIVSYQVTNTLPYTDIDILNYFNNIIKYFKYDITY